MQNQEKEIIDIRRCTKCKAFMTVGFMNEGGIHVQYFCSDNCLNASIPSQQQKEAIEEGFLFWTDWYDDTTVFVIFDNQYTSLEDAEYIQKHHGNPTNRIRIADYNPCLPVYSIINNTQIEVC